KISTLLGQSFFMPFALTMLACLARLRVLVQQVFRDYYPPNKQLLILECHWDGVEFCLHEKLAESERKVADLKEMPITEHGQGPDVEGLPRVSAIKYNNIEGLDEADADKLNQDSSLLGKQREEQSIDEAVKNKRNSNKNLAFHIRKEETNLNNSNDHSEECSQVGLVGNDSFLESGTSMPFPLKARPTENSGTKRKVAFISVTLPSKTATESESSGKKFKAVPDVGPSEICPPGAKESLDPFFNLLFGGNKNDSLF
ncbi:hypothetical protein KI387_022866, partial [Taxus chinensis]